MAKKKANPPKKQIRKNPAPKPRAAKAVPNTQAVGPKPQLIASKPLSTAKLVTKKELPKDKKPTSHDKPGPAPAQAAIPPESQPVPSQAPAATSQMPAPPASPPTKTIPPSPAASMPSQKPAKSKKRRQKPIPEAAPTGPAQRSVSPSAPFAPAAAVSTRPDRAATVDTAAVRRHRRLLNRRKLLRYAAVLLVIVIVPAAGFWIIQKRDEAAQTANQRLIKEVAAKAVLPTDEVPSISTVTDPSKINQQFLEKAQKGDKVLVYFQAAQAVVYRPSTGQIVNMGPLSAPSPRVWLRAGSPKADIPKIGTEINSGGDFVVVSNDASVNQNYQHTTVIDLTGNRPDIAKRLAEQLHATVGQLPENENKPDADLLVIIGSDNNRP